MTIIINEIEYITSKEVCEIYKISNQLLQYWRKIGLKNYKRSSKKIYYTKLDIDNFILGKNS